MDRVPLRGREEVRGRPGRQPRGTGGVLRVLLLVPTDARPGHRPGDRAPGQRRTPRDDRELRARELPGHRGRDFEQRPPAARQRARARDRDRVVAVGGTRRPEGDADGDEHGLERAVPLPSQLRPFDPQSRDHARRPWGPHPRFRSGGKCGGGKRQLGARHRGDRDLAAVELRPVHAGLPDPHDGRRFLGRRTPGRHRRRRGVDRAPGSRWLLRQQSAAGGKRDVRNVRDGDRAPRVDLSRGAGDAPGGRDQRGEEATSLATCHRSAAAHGRRPASPDGLCQAGRASAGGRDPGSDPRPAVLTRSTSCFRRGPGDLGLR